MSIPTDKDPLKLSGLTQAVYILKCLEKGESQQVIIEKFDDDLQLVKMWMSFMIHNGWIEKSDGKWSVTDKGKPWIKTMEDRFSNKK